MAFFTWGRKESVPWRNILPKGPFVSLLENPRKPATVYSLNLQRCFALPLWRRICKYTSWKVLTCFNYRLWQLAVATAVLFCDCSISKSSAAGSPLISNYFLYREIWTRRTIHRKLPFLNGFLLGFWHGNSFWKQPWRSMFSHLPLKRPCFFCAYLLMLIGMKHLHFTRFDSNDSCAFCRCLLMVPSISRRLIVGLSISRRCCDLCMETRFA